MDSDTPPAACPGLREPKAPGFCDKGLHCPSIQMVRYTPHQPSPAWRLSEPCNWGLDWSQDSGVQGGILA